jgi:hypothetical protein
MAQSSLEVANIALLKIGEDTVASLPSSAVANALIEPAKRSVLRLHPWNFATQRASIALKTITNCADNGSGAIRVTVATHGWSTGNRVTISEVSGTTEALGTWTITVNDANTFDLDTSTFSNAYVSGGKAGLAPAHGYAYKHDLPSDFLRLIDVDESLVDSVYRVEGGKLLTDEGEPRIIYIADVTDYTLMDTLFYEAFSTYLAWMMAAKLTEDEKRKQILYQEFQEIMAKARFVDGTEDSPRNIVTNDWLASRATHARGAY